MNISQARWFGSSGLCLCCKAELSGGEVLENHRINWWLNQMSYYKIIRINQRLNRLRRYSADSIPGADCQAPAFHLRIGYSLDRGIGSCWVHLCLILYLYFNECQMLKFNIYQILNSQIVTYRFICPFVFFRFVHMFVFFMFFECAGIPSECTYRKSIF